MKLTKSVFGSGNDDGRRCAQNPNIINNVQNKMTAVEQKQAADSNAALGITEEPANATTSKPAPGAPAPAVRPAAVPNSKPVAASKPVSAATAKPTTAPKAKPSAETATASNPNNKLERVNVVRHTDDIQIDISSRDEVTPRVSKMSSPPRLVVELPATAMATAQSKISVGSEGVKGVRIGMDGKTPPTTSVVVDLEKALGYELTPGPSNKFVLTLHTQATAKSTPASVPARGSRRLQTVAAKPVVAPVAAAPKAAKVAAVTCSAAPKVAKAAAVAIPAAPKATAGTVAAAKPAATTHAASTKIAADEALAPLGKTAEASKAPKPEEKKWAMNGKRDPFFSPVVQQATGSGCSTGKKCLEIGQINVRGVVKAESGFIAVVTNSLNKAYFLHENDPVFNGYVVRITGDSVVFQETVQDKLGNSVTRERTKRSPHRRYRVGDEAENRVQRRTRGSAPRVAERRNAKASSERNPTVQRCWGWWLQPRLRRQNQPASETNCSG